MYENMRKVFVVSAVSSLCIVGDRFAGFAVRTRALTLSSFLKGVTEGAYDDVSGPMLLRGGQGIGGYEWDHIRDALARRGLEERVLPQGHPPRLARRTEAHKHISTVRKTY